MEELQALATNNSKLLDIQDSNTAYLEALKTTMFNKFDALSAKIDRLQADVTDSKQNTVSKTAEIDDDIKESIRETEKILKKIDKKNEEPPKDSKWQLELSSAINRQQETLNDLLEVATNTSKNLSFFSTKTDLEELTNETHENFQAMKKEIMEKNDQVVNNLSTKINEGVLIIGHGQEEINQTLVDLIRKEDNLHSGVSKSYEQLLKEIKSLSETERVIIQTADNILDIKRRIEYGVQQILLEIGGLIKLESKNLNGTINSRFDTVEETFLENQTTALANLSLKIETEISQVWRQIGIMYQKLTMSVDTLDKLQQQTDTYVNGSTRAMDSIDGKVGTITNRMTEVEDNLNYLLGKLSLVTSEFNQIKSGLASALDNIRSDFMDVHNEIKDSEPGPKQVSNDLRI